MVNINWLKEKFRRLYEKYKEWDHISGIEWAPIERTATVNGKRIRIRYEPHVKGYLRFTNDEGEPYDLTNAGAFATMNSVWDALKDVKMDKIYYELRTDENHFKTKEKLYAREMSRHGYEQVGKPKKYLDSSNVHYFWRKRQEKRQISSWSGLEKVTATASILGVIGGIFFLSSKITGNAIANVSQSSGNILGAVLLVVGLVAGFFWVKKK